MSQTTKQPLGQGETGATSHSRLAQGTPANPAQRAAAGKAARVQAPLEAHADFRPGPSRDPVALLLGQAETRVVELVPIRHGRMETNRRRLLDQFTLVDVAHKVVGVGSVGTRAWVLLFEGGGAEDFLPDTGEAGWGIGPRGVRRRH